MKVQHLVNILPIFCTIASTAIIRGPSHSLISPAPHEVYKRGSLSCMRGELGVSPVEQKIFERYFKKEDACFFQKYSEDYFEEILVDEKPEENEPPNLQTRIRNIKIVASALKKVGKALKNIDALEVKSGEQAKEMEVVNAAKYIMNMWTTIFRELEAEDWDDFSRCFSDKDVPYKNLTDFFQRHDSLRVKIGQLDGEKRTLTAAPRSSV